MILVDWLVNSVVGKMGRLINWWVLKVKVGGDKIGRDSRQGRQSMVGRVGLS